MGLKKIGLGLLMALMTLHASAQFTYGTTGLLHMPNAEMQKDATLVVGGNFLNKHNLPNDNWWGYDSYNYFINITFFFNSCTTSKDMTTTIIFTSNCIYNWSSTSNIYFMNFILFIITSRKVRLEIPYYYVIIVTQLLL